MGATPSQVFDEESGYYMCRECKYRTDVHSDNPDPHEPWCSHAQHSHEDRIAALEERVAAREALLGVEGK